MGGSGTAEFAVQVTLFLTPNKITFFFFWRRSDMPFKLVCFNCKSVQTTLLSKFKWNYSLLAKTKINLKMLFVLASRVSNLCNVHSIYNVVQILMKCKINAFILTSNVCAWLVTQSKK